MKGNRWRGVVMVVGLAIFTVWTLFPFLWIISTSIKPDRDLYRKVSLWLATITDAHFIEVLFETPFPTYFRNSFMVATLTTLIAMVVAVLAAMRPNAAELPGPRVHRAGDDRDLPDPGGAPLHPANSRFRSSCHSGATRWAW